MWKRDAPTSKVPTPFPHARFLARTASRGRKYSTLASSSRAISLAYSSHARTAIGVAGNIDLHVVWMTAQRVTTVWTTSSQNVIKRMPFAVSIPWATAFRCEHFLERRRGTGDGKHLDRWILWKRENVADVDLANLQSKSCEFLNLPNWVKASTERYLSTGVGSLTTLVATSWRGGGESLYIQSIKAGYLHLDYQRNAQSASKQAINEMTAQRHQWDDWGMRAWSNIHIENHPIFEHGNRGGKGVLANHRVEDEQSKAIPTKIQNIKSWFRLHWHKSTRVRDKLLNIHKKNHE